LEVGRDDEARDVVYKLHGTNDREAAELEYQEMHDTIKAELSVRSRKLSDLWATRAMMRRTFVSVGVQVFCQFTGINGMNYLSSPKTYPHTFPCGAVINYFGPQMYATLGITGHKALLVQGSVMR
jgi:hypothetical protein